MTHHLLLCEGLLLVCPQAIHPYHWYIPSIEKTHLLPAHSRPAELIKSHSIITDIHNCLHRHSWKSRKTSKFLQWLRESTEIYTYVSLIDTCETHKRFVDILALVSDENHLKKFDLMSAERGRLTLSASQLSEHMATCRPLRSLWLCCDWKRDV